MTTSTETRPPADAVTVHDWEGCGVPFRCFTGSSWRVPVSGDPWLVVGDGCEITVEIRGRQFDDGRIERWVYTSGRQLGQDFDLPPVAARMLAESYAAAVAEIERLSR